MNYTDTHNDLFDRYLRNELSPEEIVAFEQLRAEDKEFAAAFEVHKLLVWGIQDHGRQELKDFLKQHTPAEGGGIGLWTGKIWYAAAAVVLICIGAYAIIRFYGHDDLRESQIAVMQKSEESAMDTIGMAVHEAEVPDMDMAAPQKERDIQAKGFTFSDAAPPVALESESMEEAKNMGQAGYDRMIVDDKSEITIVSEKKLADTLLTLPVLFASLEEMNYSNNNALNNTYYERKARSKKMVLPSGDNNNNVSNDLNKARKDATDTIQQAAARVAAPASKENAQAMTRTLKVEFWQSPVNFRGYRYLGDLVQLYGLSANNTRLFMLNNLVYVKSGGVIYALSQCSDACPYRIETNTETINFINSQ